MPFQERSHKEGLESLYSFPVMVVGCIIAQTRFKSKKTIIEYFRQPE